MSFDETARVLRPRLPRDAQPHARRRARAASSVASDARSRRNARSGCSRSPRGRDAGPSARSDRDLTAPNGLEGTGAMATGEVDAKAAAINEYGKLMLQHKVRALSRHRPRGRPVPPARAPPAAISRAFASFVFRARRAQRSPPPRLALPPLPRSSTPRCAVCATR